jgi:hypothetical protein
VRSFARYLHAAHKSGQLAAGREVITWADQSSLGIRQHSADYAASAVSTHLAICPASGIIPALMSN